MIGHWINDNWKYNLDLLDIIELMDLVHSREYLAEKLSEITDSLRITNAISLVTWDNISSNNSILDEFESLVEDYKRLYPNDTY